MRRRETEWVYVHVRQYCERVCPSDVMLKKRGEREREKKKEEKMPPQFVDVPFDLDVSISFFRETHTWK